jgi:hypothetical protein
MKLIIAGGRDLYVTSLFIDHVCAFFNIPDAGSTLPEEVVSGCASGIDTCGEIFAADVGIPVTKFPADWDRLGPKAGPIRNAQMAEYADALLLIWDGQSRGSANMKHQMQRVKKPIYEVILKATTVSTSA